MEQLGDAIERLISSIEFDYSVQWHGDCNKCTWSTLDSIGNGSGIDLNRTQSNSHTICWFECVRLPPELIEPNLGSIKFD